MVGGEAGAGLWIERDFREKGKDVIKHCLILWEGDHSILN